jgi:lantibiotic modifying enzyme
LSANITRWIQHHVHKLEENLSQTDPSDGSVYTGHAGIALLYMRLAALFPEQKNQYMSKAKSLIDLALKQLDGRVITFLCGDAGPLAIAAVIYHNAGDQKNANSCIEKIVSMKRNALSSSNPDEYLYGRAGYLYTLMFLRRELGHHVIDTQLITDVFQAMIKSGEKYARETGSQSPLMYKWHDSEYMGAAHGVSGIVYLLLRVTHHESFSHLRPYVDSHLIPTVEFLKTKRLPSGNYLSSSDSKSDRLVQWCHGAPGFIYLFVRAYEITGNSSYIERALSAGDVVWQRGILTKGYGLCHGTAGNGYVFLDLYRVTHDLKWLHRAIKFAEFCLDYGKHHLPSEPDNPYSLFEGLAGTIYFMTDILNPSQARFPAFE